MSKEGYGSSPEPNILHYVILIWFMRRTIFRKILYWNDMILRKRQFIFTHHHFFSSLLCTISLVSELTTIPPSTSLSLPNILRWSSFYVLHLFNPSLWHWRLVGSYNDRAIAKIRQTVENHTSSMEEITTTINVILKHLE